MAGATHGSGIYFDGVSGRRQFVTVDLTEDAIVIATPEGAPIARWPYPEAMRAPSVRGRLRLGLAGNGPPARLSVPEPAFAETVADRLGVLTTQIEAKERHRRYRVVEWSIAAVAMLLVLAVVGMPPLAELLLPLVSAEAEARIGLQVDDAYRTTFEGPGSFECGSADGEKEGHAAFLKLIGKLESAAGLPVRLRPVVVRQQKTVNAAAGPGGYVYVYYGIIRFADTPDELAGILAHELGHVAHRDTVRMLLADTGTAYLFGILLGDFFGSGAMFYSAGKVLHARHSRPQEAAADAYSVPLMAKAGGDPYGAALFFEHFVRVAGADQAELLDDHPTHGARVAAMRAIPARANPTPLLTPDEWKALKRICTPDDKQICDDEYGDPAIAACTRAIDSGRHKNDELAILFYERGVEYNAKSDPDRAIADYDEAIRLNPKYRAAFIQRGDAYATKQDYDRAVADYSQAIEIAPKEATSLQSRGIVRLHKGDLANALADLNQATQLDPKDAYIALWLDIVNGRSNLASRLPQAIAQLDMAKWPAPLIRLYMGQMTPEAALAAADDPSESKKKRQVCEANFYSGELALQQGAKDRAARLFRLAAADCSKRGVESWSSNAELKTLGIR